MSVSVSVSVSVLCVGPLCRSSVSVLCVGPLCRSFGGEPQGAPGGPRGLQGSETIKNHWFYSIQGAKACVLLCLETEELENPLNLCRVFNCLLRTIVVLLYFPDVFARNAKKIFF